MFVVGLTGGIGSGKSTVAALFADRGAAVVDADAVARDMVAPGTAGLVALVAVWGSAILTPSGELDRERLRAIAFADPGARRQLETILHPLIRERLFATFAARSEAPYGIAVVPLLLESGWRADVDRILVVDLPESVQRQRAMQRDGMSAQQLDLIMAAQCARAERLAAADDVLDNSGTAAALEPQVERLHRLYLAMASGGKG